MPAAARAKGTYADRPVRPIGLLLQCDPSEQQAGRLRAEIQGSPLQPACVCGAGGHVCETRTHGDGVGPGPLGKPAAAAILIWGVALCPIPRLLVLLTVLMMPGHRREPARRRAESSE